MPPNYPLLLFPEPASADREKLPSNQPKIHRPNLVRQGERIGPKFSTLQAAFEAQRLKLQQEASTENPELVLVVETIGTVDSFVRASRGIPGLEWLVEWTEDEIPPDEDFYREDGRDKTMSGRLFMVASNDTALAQILSLWERYKADPKVKLERGLAPFKQLFSQMRDIRPWSVADRLGVDIREYWTECLSVDNPNIRFEIEAWHYVAQSKNDAAAAELEFKITLLNGHILKRGLLSEIAYHGFLVELPRAAVAEILAGGMPELVLSNRVMFFRPKGQALSAPPTEIEIIPQQNISDVGQGLPVVALLDGLPQQNHPLLAGRLDVDDPDGWEESYEAKDRVHGTAMASLILHGELAEGEVAATRRLYVRPILRPDLTDTFNLRRQERTPDDSLLVDLIHRAVKRICEGDNGEGAAAPTVRVINLSIGDVSRVFDREISPFARLLDWLSYKYSILFVVSAGNAGLPLEINAAPGTLGGLAPQALTELALDSLLETAWDRRLIAPAEAVNALTVGAAYNDQSTFTPTAGRFSLFSNGSISPFSRIGHGFRRSLKPDVLMPGGRVLHREAVGNGAAKAVLEQIATGIVPGQRAAIPPLAGQSPNATIFCRGTSNAAALTSRCAIQIYDTLESLRGEGAQLPSDFDAVLIKALLAHGASWGSLSTALLARRPALTDYAASTDFLARWLGYGAVDTTRVLSCTDERATLIGVGHLTDGEGLLFSAPLPPSLAGKVLWKRLTVTLAWLSPINPGHQAYRRARMWLTAPNKDLRVSRKNTAHFRAVQRGTLQHEIFEGEDALAFVDGARFVCKVNCLAEAGKLTEDVKFALCVSFEVGVGVGVPLYEEMRSRISPPITIQPNAG